MIIFESENFTIEAVEHPLVDRNDGGHITINPRFKVSTRQQLTPRQAIELMQLSIVAGEAMTNVLLLRGVDIGRVNYQDNGNWSVFAPEGPQLHLHIYGRAKSAKIQKYGQACYFPHRDEDPGFYSNNECLYPEDVRLMKNEIERLLKEDRFSHNNWRL
ncbi:MAG TPA: hypothetical protein VFE50_25160 [Cyclobacteriaceae bacterium]|nr:hypothetical protein [Cyclobacteriaceae bacterium]